MHVLVFSYNSCNFNNFLNLFSSDLDTLGSNNNEFISVWLLWMKVKGFVWLYIRHRNRMETGNVQGIFRRKFNQKTWFKSIGTFKAEDPKGWRSIQNCKTEGLKCETKKTARTSENFEVIWNYLVQVRKNQSVYVISWLGWFSR